MAAEPGYYHDNFVAHLRASFGRLSEAMALTLDTFSHKIMNKQSARFSSSFTLAPVVLAQLLPTQGWLTPGLLCAQLA
jgi:hypothetical protein